MPLVRITLRDDTPVDTQRAIADGVHRALVQTVGVPVGDRFQIIESQPAHALVFDPSYLDIDRQDVVFVQITLVRGRSVEVKRALHAAIADELGTAGVRRADVFVALTEFGREDMSAGNGEAQLLDTELMLRHGWTPPAQ